MNILVTGGCGLAGSFAVRYAVEQGHRVVAFDIALKTDLLTDLLTIQPRDFHRFGAIFEITVMEAS